MPPVDLPATSQRRLGAERCTHIKVAGSWCNNLAGNKTPLAVSSPSRLLATFRSEDQAMKASVFVGVSVDGFMARANGALDFLPPGGGEPHGYEEFMATVDALVIGRHTYETVLGFEAWPYGDKPVIALSTHALAAPPAGAVLEQMSASPEQVVSALAARGIGHIYVDGGITIQGFLRAGLVQRLVVTRVPVLIGEGIPLFGPLARDIPLRHVATRQYASGLVQSEYIVEPA